MAVCQLPLLAESPHWSRSPSWHGRWGRRCCSTTSRATSTFPPRPSTLAGTGTIGSAGYCYKLGRVSQPECNAPSFSFFLQKRGDGRGAGAGPSARTRSVHHGEGHADLAGALWHVQGLQPHLHRRAHLPPPAARDGRTRPLTASRSASARARVPGASNPLHLPREGSRTTLLSTKAAAVLRHRLPRSAPPAPGGGGRAESWTRAAGRRFAPATRVDRARRSPPICHSICHLRAIWVAGAGTGPCCADKARATAPAARTARGRERVRRVPRLR